MSTRFSTLSSVLLVLVLLAAFGSEDHREKLSSRSAADLGVVDQREVWVEGGIIQSLSPDGKWLAVERDQALCVHRVDTLAEQSCVQAENGFFDFLNAAWSPDSTRLAFTEDPGRSIQDSDLWVLEVEGGSLINLTDDGVGSFESATGLGDMKALVDYAPTWSPGGETIAFLRSVFDAGEWDGTALFRVPSSGGEAEELLRVSAEVLGPFAIYGPHWSSDGATIFYTLAGPDVENSGYGIWAVGQDGQNPHRLLSATDPELGPPALVDISEQNTACRHFFPRWLASSLPLPGSPQ